MKRFGVLRIRVLARLVLLLGGVFLLGIWGAQPGLCAQSGLPKEVGFATYPVGFGQYVIVSGWCKILSEHTPMKVVAKPLVGPTVYTRQVNAGIYDIGSDSGASLYRGYRAQGEYKKKLSNLRALWRDHVKQVTVLAVRADSGIKKISDLKGKRVTSDFGGNLNLQREVQIVLLSGGLTWDDIVKVPVDGLKGSVVAAREGRVDAFFAAGPTVPAIMELASAVPLRFLPVQRPFKEMFKKHPEAAEWLPGTTDIVIKPRGALKEQTIGITLPMWFASSTHFTEEAAYLIVKAVFENYKKVQPVFFEVRNFTPEVMFAEPPIPYHAGAVRLYKEKGVWTKKYDQAQKALLKRR